MMDSNRRHFYRDKEGKRYVGHIVCQTAEENWALERSSTIPQGTPFGRQPKSVDDETDRE